MSVRAGMRRPSWNKSQAIQQVISLKALLEPCDDDDVSATHNLRRRVVPPQSQPGHVSASLSLSLSLTLLLILIFDISLPLKKKVSCFVYLFLTLNVENALTFEAFVIFYFFYFFWGWNNVTMVLNN